MTYRYQVAEAERDRYKARAEAAEAKLDALHGALWDVLDPDGRIRWPQPQENPNG